MKNVDMQSSIAVGISLPKDIVSKIDSERGDISRSRYLLKILERNYRDGIFTKDIDQFTNNIQKLAVELGVYNQANPVVHRSGYNT
jgi:hypothetical protein